MNVDQLTSGEVKQLQSLLNNNQNTLTAKEHPFVGKHCVVRTYAAGVHLGTVVSVDGSQCILNNARRLWKWENAFTLSEVANNGVGKDSRIAEEVPTISLSDMIELIPSTEEARKAFDICHE